MVEVPYEKDNKERIPFEHYLEEYRKIRGLYVDVADWNIPYGSTVEDLLKKMEAVEQIDWKQKMNRHLELLGSCETGEAARILVAYVESVTV